MPDSLSTLFGRYGAHILDAIPDAVFITDVTGKALFVNRVYEQLTGLGKKDIIGKNVRLLVEEGIFDIALNPEIVRTGKPVSSAQTIKNGVKLALSGFPVIDTDGDLRLVVTFARDITLLSSLQSQVESQRKLIERISGQLAHVANEKTPDEPVFVSQAMKDIRGLLNNFANSDATLLILGETGVGKDVFCRLAHSLSARRDKLLVKVDCGGIAENLIESELFGYMPGAFTGASSKGKAGYFEMADGGAIFLDEIGELPLAMQTRLLRVLQDGEIARVGSATPRKVDVRVIAATNRDLGRCVEEGTFRRDLYYRLNVATIHIPPLRERPEDVRPLAAHYLRLYAAKYHKTLAFAESALALMESYDWPGNVRELQNMAHSLAITMNGPLIAPDDLPAPVQGVKKRSGRFPEEVLAANRPLKEIMADLELDFLKQAIAAHGSVRQVAKLFHVDKSTIFRKLQAAREKEGVHEAQGS